MRITENILSFKRSIPGHVRIIAVSKNQPISAILEAYEAGQRDFGENKVQEMVIKRSQLPSDIEWHFIGHLQTNKVRHMVSFVCLIHSIDSYNLLQEINKKAMKCNRVVDCLLQFHIATEETKYGMDMKEAASILQSEGFKNLNNIRIQGVMGMASFSEDLDLVSREFRCLHGYYETLKELYFKGQDTFSIISMGMSGDYMLAIAEGSNMVRIGTSIFGNRS